MKSLSLDCLSLKCLFALSVALVVTNMPIQGQDTKTDSNAETFKSEAEAIEPRFPRQIRLSGGVATMHEPQIDSHEGYRSITGWLAVSYKSYDESVDIVGALKLKASIVVDFEDRTVTVFDRKLLESYFPELEQKDADALAKQIADNFRQEPEIFPLDVMLAYLADSVDQGESLAVSMDPPAIFYSSGRAMLVNIDGEPAFRPINEESDLHLVVNSTWDLFQTKRNKNYYLLMGKHWLKSKNLEGPWKPAGKLPKSFQSLPEEERFKNARAAVPGDWIDKKDVPEIFVSKEPAELIVTDGAPKLKAIEFTSLFEVSNTTSDLFYHNENLKYYFLTSGRWFNTEDLQGPWEHAGDLPESFQAIPEDHPRAHVRASIPGTIEAKFAVLEAQVPKTAVVARDLEAPDVSYFGEAKFEPIESTSISRAANTDSDIFFVSGKYYMCHKAVWFTGETENGPWIVADDVPSEIYAIPVSSPSHHVTYVAVDDHSHGHVHFSYTSGYHHSYISYGTVVYGSGYYWGFGWNYYDPFYPYPHWGYPYHYPHTYGAASFYNPRTGTYGHGHYTYGPYGGVWAGERFNPKTGRYGQGEYAWDYNTGIYSGRSYNPRNNIATSTNQGFQYYGDNEYESWGESKIQRGNDWIKSNRYSNQDGSAYRFETSEGGIGGRLVTDDGKRTAFRTGSGDLYAGKDGNVYRRSSEGGWERRSDGDWDKIEFYTGDRLANRASPSLNSEQRQNLQSRASQFDRDNLSPLSSGRAGSSASTRSYLDQLNRDSFSRGYGNQRYQSYQRSPRSAGSRGSNFGTGSRGGFRRR